MKDYLRPISLLALIVAGLFASCQDEEYDSLVGNASLTANSPLSQRLVQATINNTAIDNAIDSSSCFSVRLPFEIVIGDVNFTISQISDYAQVESFLESSQNASIDFVFPITLVAADYGTTTVANQQQFEALTSEDCNAPQVLDCLSIVFPMTVSAYNGITQTPSVITFHNDAQLAFFLLSLGPDDYYQIDFPITVSTDAVQSVVVTDNSALDEALQNAIADCDCQNPGILTDDLIFYATFANEVADLTGLGQVNIIGATSFVTDRSQNANAALSFDEGGIENFIAVSSGEPGDLMQEQRFSISLWFNRQNPDPASFENLFVTNQMTLSLGSSPASEIRSPFVQLDAQNSFTDISWEQENLLGALNEWHHIVITYDAGAFLLYRDGLVRSEFESGLESPLSILRLGGNFRGWLDDVRVYKRRLNPDEVTTLFELEGDVSQCLD